MTPLRERRRALGMTQPQLAAELGVTPLTIKRLEKLPELPRLYDLAVQAIEARPREATPGALSAAP